MYGDTLYIVLDAFMQGGVHQSTDEPFTFGEIQWLVAIGVVTSQRADITETDFKKAGFSCHHVHRGTAAILPSGIEHVISLGCADYYFLIRDQNIQYTVYDTIRAWRESPDYPNGV